MKDVKQVLAGMKSLVDGAERRAQRTALYRNTRSRPGATLGDATERATRTLGSLRARDAAAARENLEHDLERLGELTDVRLVELSNQLTVEAENARRNYDRKGETRADTACWRIGRELVRRRDERDAPLTDRVLINESGDVLVSRGNESWYENARGLKITPAILRGRIDEIWRDVTGGWPSESFAERKRRLLGPLADVSLE